jgi:cytochrome b561
MLLKNSNTHYGKIAIILHWIMALLLIGLLILGLYMVELPIGLEKLKMYGWHKEYGILVLMLVFMRFFWRLTNNTPSLNIPLLEKIAARTVHWLFYLFMFALPITGWLMTSAAGLPVSFFGLFVLPNLVSANQQSLALYQEIHKWLAYGLIATFFLHSAAALKHHFINKDDILKRMLR